MLAFRSRMVPRLPSTMLKMFIFSLSDPSTPWLARTIANTVAPTSSIAAPMIIAVFLFISFTLLQGRTGIAYVNTIL